MSTWPMELRRLRLSLALLTERRGPLLIILDFFFLLSALLMALLGNGSATDFYLPLTLLPLLFVGVPIMADAVSVERRSGTLDLALTSPGAKYYFERRIAGVTALLALQGCLTIIVARLLAEGFPLSGPLTQSTVSALFAGCVAFNWSLRMRSAGAATLATYVTVALFGRWFFANPIHPPTTMNGPMTATEIAAFVRNNVVLLAAAFFFYVYGRRRLSSPESIIS